MSILAQLTILINYSIKTLIVLTVSKMGYQSETQKSIRAFLFIFSMQYFNTGWLMMLSNASLKNQGFFFEDYFRGSEPDLDMNWYLNHGTLLVQSMIFNIYMPILYESTMYGLRVAKRAFDKISLGGSTKCTSQLEYI